MRAARGLSVALCAVIAAAAAACDEEGGDGGDGEVDAGPDGNGGGGETQTFVEDFLDESLVDPAKTTATIDTAGTGFARAEPPIVMLGTGDGSEGAVVLDMGGNYPAGLHQLTSFEASGMPVTIDGDTTLLVQGDFTVSNHADLNVNGTLTLVVGGTLSIDCAIIKASKDVVVMHPDAATPIKMGCKQSPPGEGSIATTNLADPAATSGSITVDTRGPIELDDNGYFYSGRNNAGASGDVTIRAYGNITLNNGSYFITSDATAPGAQGVLTVKTEGNLALDLDSYLISGRGRVGGGVVVRVGGDLGLSEDSYILTSTNTGASVDVAVEGALTMTLDSYIITGNGVDRTPSIDVVAGSVHLTDSFINTTPGSTTTRGGPVSIRVAGPLLLDGYTYLNSGGGPCLPGSDLTLEAGGDITIAGIASVEAGESFDGEGCSKLAGGDVIAHSAAAVLETSTTIPALQPGVGATEGSVDLVENGDVAVDADAQLRTAAVVESKALPLLSPGAVVGGAVTPGNVGAELWISPDGTDGAFAPVGNLVGTALTADWRYRLIFGARFYDGEGVDKLEVMYQ